LSRVALKGDRAKVPAGLRDEEFHFIGGQPPGGLTVNHFFRGLALVSSPAAILPADRSFFTA
jgi:hypothetical protein